MTRNTTEVDDDSTADPPDDQSGGDGELYDTTRMTRRDALKAGGAAAATLALGTGTAYADHGSSDPIDVGDDGNATDNTDVEPARYSAGSAAIGALTMGPVGALAGGAIGSEAQDAVGDWLYGGYRDRIDTQLQADLIAHAETVSNSNAWSLKQLDNRLAVSKNNWIAQAQFNVIQKLNEVKPTSTNTTTNTTTTSTSTSTSTTTTDSAKQDAVDAGVQGVLDAAATLQKNLLAIESATILRYASFNARESAAGIAVTDRRVQPRPHGSGEDLIVQGVKPLHVTLVNGETVEAWGLHLKHTGTADGTVERVLHSHVVHTDTVATGDPALPAAAGGAAKLHAHVDELQYNSTAGRVEYVDPETGNTLRTATPVDGAYPSEVIGGSPVMRVQDLSGATTLDGQLLPRPVFGEIRDDVTSTNEGVAGYWSMEVYPLISVLCSEVETYASDVYDAVAAGEIDVSDLMTPAIFAEELARDWSSSGDTGYSRALLAQLGIDTDLKTSMDVVVANNTDASTTLDYSAIGETAAFTHSLSNASGEVTVVVDPGGASDSSGTMHVPGGTETLNVRVEGFTDDPSSPSYAVQDVTLTTAGGTTVTVPVSEFAEQDGHVAAGEAWYDELDADGDGSVTISSIDVTYAVTADDGTTSQYTDTVVSGAGLQITIDASGVAWRYQDARLATDWRPHGGDPDQWSTATKERTTFTGVTLSDTTDGDTVDVTVGFAHDGSPDTSTSPTTYTVPSSRSLNVQLAGTTSNVTAVTITTASGTTHTVSVPSGETFVSLAHTDVASAGSDYTIDTVSVEYNNSSGGTSTATAGTVSQTLSVEDTNIPTYDFLTGRWYYADNKGADDEIVVATADGAWVDVGSTDVFKITSATDADGNQLDGVVLGDTNRHSLDVSRVEEEVQRAIETQQEIEDTTPDDITGGGGGSGLGGSAQGALIGALAGGGVAAYVLSELFGGD